MPGRCDVSSLNCLWGCFTTCSRAALNICNYRNRKLWKLSLNLFIRQPHKTLTWLGVSGHWLRALCHRLLGFKVKYLKNSPLLEDKSTHQLLSYAEVCGLKMKRIRPSITVIRPKVGKKPGPIFRTSSWWGSPPPCTWCFRASGMETVCKRIVIFCQMRNIANFFSSMFELHLLILIS